MKFMPGGSLSKRAKGFAGDPRAAAGLMEKVARAVGYLHGKGVVHRDLKPLNVLLDEQGEPHVADFGIAKFTDTDLEHTHTGAVIGTRPYMAPEQAVGRNKDVDRASDIWALGVMLYELLVGQRPFKGDSDDALTRRILSTDPERPRKLQPKLDADLETIVLKCLRKDRSDRYASAAALADDLHHWLADEPITARPESVLRRTKRAAKRHPAVTAALLFLATTGVLAAAVAPYLDPNQPRFEAERRFARGEPVTLIPARGLPLWHRWAGEDWEGTIRPNHADGSCTIRGLFFAILELAPVAPRSPYRIRAEVRHDDVNGAAAAVGVFVGHHKGADANGRVQERFTSVEFSDREVKGTEYLMPDGRSAGLALVRFHTVTADPGPRDSFHDQKYSVSPLTPFDPAARDRGTVRWRHLVIDVGREQVSASFDEQTLTPADFQTLKARGDASFEPAGGIGVFVYQGVASFRNLTVTPLESR
jgi:hypothetical protein